MKKRVWSGLIGVNGWNQDLCWPLVCFVARLVGIICVDILQIHLLRRIFGWH